MVMVVVAISSPAVAFTVTVVSSATVIVAGIVNTPSSMVKPSKPVTDHAIVASFAKPVAVKLTVCCCPFKVTSGVVVSIFGVPVVAFFTTVTSYSPFALEPSTAVAVTVIFAFSTAVSVTVNKPSVLIATSPSFRLASNVIDHFTLGFVALLGVTFAFNCNSPPISTSLLSAVTSIPVTSISSSPSIGFTSGGFFVPDTFTAAGSFAVISLIALPSPVMVAASLFSEVILILPTSVPSATAIVAFAVPSTVNSFTFAAPSKATVASASLLIATLSTVPCTVTVASTGTSTVVTVAPSSTVIAAPFSFAVTVPAEPFAISIEACASTVVVVKPTILVAILAINVLIVFSASSVVFVKISTGFALVTPSSTVTLSINFVPLVNVMVNLSSAILLLAAATTASSPM